MFLFKSRYTVCVLIILWRYWRIDQVQKYLNKKVLYFNLITSFPRSSSWSYDYLFSLTEESCPSLIVKS